MRQRFIRQGKVKTYLFLQNRAAEHLNGHFTERVQSTSEETGENDGTAGERSLRSELEVVVRRADDKS